MSEKEKFYLSLKKFFDASVLREIYSSDDLSICNVSNCCYAVFDYELSNKMPIPYAYALEAGYIESIMNDNSSFYKWAANIPKHEKNKHIISFTDKMLSVMIEKKKQTDIMGPLISLEYEQELIEKYGKNKSR